jgi:TatD DNase family protein
MFIDTHSHIHVVKDFPDVDEILSRARDVGVTRQIIVGCTVEDSFNALKFVQDHPDFDLWATLGVHPHNANEWNDEVAARFRQSVRNEKKIVAIGEIGLDYFRNLQPKEIQIPVFKAQLHVAKELNLPAVVHVRDAWEDALKIIRESGNTKVILHCFSGTVEQAKYCWSNGYHTSFSGVLTYPKNGYLREIAAQAPPELILIETDCPYLTPQVFRGKRNEPAFVVETAKVLAQARGASLEKTGEQTTLNALKLFGIS